MINIIKKPFLVLVILILVFQSCTTIRANIFLYQVTTSEEKAVLLYNEGIRLYADEFIENNNLKVIPKIIRHLSDAIKLDPTLEDVNDYISELENFKQDLFVQSMENINELSILESRTENEDYKLVLSIKQANELKIKNKTLKEKTKEFKYLIPTVVATIETKLTEIESQILITEDHNDIVTLSIKYKKILNEIQEFDYENELAIISLLTVDNRIMAITNSGLDDAKAQMENRDFVNSELVIRKTEKLYISYFKTKSDKIIDFKYNLFLNWGEYLYGKRQYQIAKNITKLAYNINRSSESMNLIKKIDKAVSATSFESTINDILASIDFYIEKEDPVNAQKVIDNNLKKFKNQKNRNSISKKKDEIDSEIDRIYNEGILLYQDEDFEGALGRFSIVYKYNDNHKQIKDYYDRTDRKVKALSGIY